MVVKNGEITYKQPGLMNRELPRRNYCKEVHLPHIDISMLYRKTNKKRVADAVIETKIKELGCQRSHLSVAVHDVDLDNWNETVHDKVDMSRFCRRILQG